MTIRIQVALVLMALMAGAVPVHGTCATQLIVASSEHSKGRLTTERASKLLCAIATQLEIDPRVVRIVIVQIRSDEGGVVEIVTNTIRTARIEAMPGSMHYLWLIGDVNDWEITRLLGSILVRAAGIHPNVEEYMAAVRRAVIAADITVDKNAFVK